MSGIIGQIGSNSGFVEQAVKKHQYKTAALSNSWDGWAPQGNTSHEDGVTVQNMGRVWIMAISIEKGSISAGTSGYEVIVNIASEFTMPNGIVTLGCGHFGNPSDNDYSSLIELHTSGNVYLYYNNGSANSMQVHANFIGLDIS